MGCSMSVSVAKIMMTAATAPASTDADITPKPVNGLVLAGMICMLENPNPNNEIWMSQMRFN
jgi:hypothetical protein